MRLRSPFFIALACLGLVAGGAGLQACSSSSAGAGSSSGAWGGDASHGGHDASGGGDDATSGDDGGSDDGGGSGDDATTGSETGVTESGTSKEAGGKDASGGKDGGAGGGDASSGGDADSDGGGGNDASGGDAADLDAGEGGAAPDCGSIPTLHVDDAGSVFCGFDADGGHLYCGTGQECCLGGALDLDAGTFAPQQCAAFGSACTNPVDGGLPIECGQISDCTANGKAGNVCCLQGATAPTIVAGCGYARASHGTGIVCETPGAGTNACAAGETQICSQDLDCPNGKVCTPMKWKLFQLGFCM
jgi:hypothetical protein